MPDAAAYSVRALYRWQRLKQLLLLSCCRDEKHARQRRTANAKETNNNQQRQAPDNETHKAATMIRRKTTTTRHSQNITVDSNPFSATALRRFKALLVSNQHSSSKF
jgi:hypothetical protein